MPHLVLEAKRAPAAPARDTEQCQPSCHCQALPADELQAAAAALPQELLKALPHMQHQAGQALLLPLPLLLTRLRAQHLPWQALRCRCCCCWRPAAGRQHAAGGRSLAAAAAGARAAVCAAACRRFCCGVGLAGGPLGCVSGGELGLICINNNWLQGVQTCQLAAASAAKSCKHCCACQ